MQGKHLALIVIVVTLIAVGLIWLYLSNFIEKHDIDRKTMQGEELLLTDKLVANEYSTIEKRG